MLSFFILYLVVVISFYVFIDLWPDMKVTFTGSSLLQILNADADLSRRVLSYALSSTRSWRSFVGWILPTPANSRPCSFSWPTTCPTTWASPSCRQGDFKIDSKITVEVGGKDKTFDQIADIPNSYILADSMEFPVGKKLPVWLVGFLY